MALEAPLCFLKHLRRRWNVRTSLVDVFASFIYLSSTRLLVTSMKLLVPITSYTYEEGPDGHMNLCIVYYLLLALSVEYFGKSHLPYALLAISLSFLFFIMPMILLFLYPFSWFQRILSNIGFNSLTLRTFVEIFQGPFKDGTNKKKDYRTFSAGILLMPFMINLTLTLTQSSMCFPIASIWILIYVTLYLVFQPYKRSLHNSITITMLLGVGHQYTDISCRN